MYLKGGMRLLKERYMRFAIELASQMKGQTTPNPPVGAVVVNDERIVGFGAHLAHGKEHAEVIAINMAAEKAIGSTVYVTLEPCSHYGKTAPCADYLISKGVRRVVVACMDPNEKVAGKGIEKLKAAGIAVEVGFLANEAKVLYDVFFHYISTNLPFITLKTAVSLDGKTATSSFDSKWITNKAARLDAHMYRHQHDAILVGVNTVINDNPRLTTRIDGGKSPLRIILDTNLRTPLEANIVTDNQADTWIFVGKNVSKERQEKYLKEHVRIIQLEEREVQIHNVLQRLGREKVTSVFVEGGATINSTFLKSRLINQLIMYMSPIIIGGHEAPGAFGGEGFTHLTDSLKLHIQQIEQIEGQIKIVATKEKEANNVYRNC